MKLGLHIAETSWRGGAPALRSNLKDIVQTAEGVGFDAINVADHVWQSHYLGGDLESQVEAYTTLGFIAAHTERVRLLALATAASYRPPGLLAKMVTTLDVLSGGRMMLGHRGGRLRGGGRRSRAPLPVDSASASRSSRRPSRPVSGCGTASAATSSRSRGGTSGWDAPSTCRRA